VRGLRSLLIRFLLDAATDRNLAELSSGYAFEGHGKSAVKLDVRKVFVNQSAPSLKRRETSVISLAVSECGPDRLSCSFGLSFVHVQWSGDCGQARPFSRNRRRLRLGFHPLARQEEPKI